MAEGGALTNWEPREDADDEQAVGTLASMMKVMKCQNCEGVCVVLLMVELCVGHKELAIQPRT